MVRILIADDVELMRNQIAQALVRQEGWSVCGEAASGEQAVALAATLKPDVILLDFLMPPLNGLQAAEQILRASPLVPTVLFTLHKNPQLEAHAKKIGVRAVISKSEQFDNVIRTIAGLIEAKGPVVGPLGVAVEAGNSAAPKEKSSTDAGRAGADQSGDKAPS